MIPIKENGVDLWKRVVKKVGSEWSDLREGMKSGEISSWWLFQVVVAAVVAAGFYVIHLLFLSEYPSYFLPVSLFSTGIIVYLVANRYQRVKGAFWGFCIYVPFCSMVTWASVSIFGKETENSALENLLASFIIFLIPFAGFIIALVVGKGYSCLTWRKRVIKKA